ncbi:MFS transporter [Streptomyces sp. NPDC002643]
MVETNAAPIEGEEKRGFSARHVLILIALLWTAQLQPLGGLLFGYAQAEIAVHFHTTQIAWISLSSALVSTFAMPFAVKAAGMFGKRRVMVVLTCLGILGDVVSVLATDYDVLIAGRAIAGLYAPALFLTYALTRDVFPKSMVGPASGVLAGGVGLIALVGPFISGWLLDSHGYKGMLWFLTAGAVVALVLLLVFVPESPVRDADGRMDWAGALLLGIGLCAIVYAIGEGSDWGWTSGKFLTYTVGGVILLAVFFVVEHKVASPVLPVALLRRRQVWTVLLATSVAAGAVYSSGTVLQILALMPNIPGMSDGLGWSATKNAVVSVPMSVTTLAVAIGVGVLARRVDSRLMLGGGALLTAVSYGMLTQMHYDAAGFITGGMIGALGMGAIVATVPIMLIESVQPEEQAVTNGAQSSIQGIVQTVMTQVAFVVMANGGVVAKGTQFYLDEGYTDGLWLVMGCCVLGAVLVLLIPKMKKLDEAEVGQAVA